MSQNDQTAVFYVVELWTDIKPNVSTSSLKGNFLLDAFNPAVHPEVALITRAVVPAPVRRQNKRWFVD